MKKPIISWDGEHLPEALKDVPVGRYMLEPIDENVELTSEEEEGIQAAIREIEAGEGLTLKQVIEEIRATSP